MVRTYSSPQPLLHVFIPLPAALWDIKKGLCSREPSCELWDDDMLLEQRERARERERVQANEQRRNLAQNEARIAYEPPPPPYVPDPEDFLAGLGWPAPNLARMHQDDTDDLSWMDNEGKHQRYV